DIDHAPPADAAQVETELVAVVDVVVDERGQQVVGERNGGKVAGEMQVDVLHRHHLRVAAAGRAALHAEYRSQGRLAQAHDGRLAEQVQRIPQPHGRGGLALPGGRRGNTGAQHQPAVGAGIELRHVVERHLRLVVPVGFETLLRYPE